MSSSNKYVLQMVNISKGFAGVQALDHVNLNVRSGTVHALVGENGAGKSTLMKVLLGMYRPDNGKILFKGEELELNNTQNALVKGISMIHQELSPVLELRICDNIYLNREPTKKIGFVNDAKMIDDTKALFKTLHFDKLNPTTKMNDLSIADMQMVEIAKAVSYRADLIIMDEPTSAISEAEVEVLFNIIKDLRTKNIAVIYITHKMDEIFKITDEITVLRDGKFIGTDLTTNFDREKLFTMMVNRDLGNYFRKTQHPIGEVVFEVENMNLTNKLHNISFTLRRGEILGLAGLVGAGRTEIAETIFGMREKSSGTIRINGKETKINSIKDAIRHKIALVTEDRKTFGLFLDLSVKFNTSICDLDQLCTKMSFVRNDKEETVVKQAVASLKVKMSNLNQLVGNLSGGNQQKVVLAKWLCTTPDILIFDEPTRGIDVGAKAEIYQIMDELARQGKSIIMISSEMPEIIGMSDRVLVIREGRIAVELEGEKTTQQTIIQYAAG
ncbi:MAG: sugar ABC transporter ATP-binding protein [Flexilinea sp.]